MSGFRETYVLLYPGAFDLETELFYSELDRTNYIAYLQTEEGERKLRKNINWERDLICLDITTGADYYLTMAARYLEESDFKPFDINAVLDKVITRTDKPLAEQLLALDMLLHDSLDTKVHDEDLWRATREALDLGDKADEDTLQELILEQVETLNGYAPIGYVFDVLKDSKEPSGESDGAFGFWKVADFEQTST